MSSLDEFAPFRFEPNEERLLRDGVAVPLTPKVWTVPVSGGQPTRLETLPFPGSSNCPFDVGGDGRSIVSTRVVRMSHEI